MSSLSSQVWFYEFRYETIGQNDKCEFSVKTKKFARKWPLNKFYIAQSPISYVIAILPQWTGYHKKDTIREIDVIYSAAAFQIHTWRYLPTVRPSLCWEST